MSKAANRQILPNTTVDPAADPREAPASEATQEKGLPTVILNVRRIFDRLRGEECVPAAVAAFDTRALQARAGSGNGFDLLLEAAMAGLVLTNFRSTLVIWGWYEYTAHHGMAFWLGLTPMRHSAQTQLLRICGGGATAFQAAAALRPVLLETADDRLGSRAQPLLQWSRDGGLVRLWGERADVPEFRRRPGQPDHVVRMNSEPLSSIPEREEKLLAGRKIVVLNRQAQVEWEGA